MNEAETRAEHIDPALRAAGWGVVDGSRVLREYQISPGRLEGHGRRGKPLIADYVLVYRDRKLAVVEAKAWAKPLTEGLAQAKNYAGKLAARLAFSTNGQGVYAADMLTGAEGERDRYPTPGELWRLVFPPAVPNERADDARGELWRDRVLLTFATGTGKTFIAFQIAWKLFHSRWSLGREPTRRPRILFLADRNTLADQAYNAFSAFPEDALVRVAPADVRKKGRVPKNGSLFFTIFQTFMSGRDARGEPAPYFGEYSPDFFDFLTREERAQGARAQIRALFPSKQQEFLEFVLSHYVREGVRELDREKLGPLLRLKYRGSIADAVADLGRADEIGRAFSRFQRHLYEQGRAA